MTTNEHDMIRNVRTQGQAMLLEVHGEVDLHNSPDLRGQLLRLLADASPKTLVLNLGGVPYMDSSAIAVLVELLGRVRKGGGAICLTHLQPRVRALLEIARLETIFRFFPADADALASLVKN